MENRHCNYKLRKDTMTLQFHESEPVENVCPSPPNVIFVPTPLPIVCLFSCQYNVAPVPIWSETPLCFPRSSANTMWLLFQYEVRLLFVFPGPLPIQCGSCSNMKWDSSLFCPPSANTMRFLAVPMWSEPPYFNCVLVSAVLVPALLWTPSMYHSSIPS
jgi:hypothetical protein